MEKLPKCRSQGDLFFIDTTLLTSIVKSLFSFLLSQPSLPWHLTSPRLSQAVGDPQICELWLAQHRNSHPSCPKSGALPVTLDKVTHLGATGKMVTQLTYILQDLCFLFLWKRSNCFSVWSATRTHHCHQSPAVKWPSACTARCLLSVLRKYVPHLLQRYAPDTSILWAGAALGPWTGPSSLF